MFQAVPRDFATNTFGAVATVRDNTNRYGSRVYGGFTLDAPGYSTSSTATRRGHQIFVATVKNSTASSGAPEDMEPAPIPGRTMGDTEEPVAEQPHPDFDAMLSDTLDVMFLMSLKMSQRTRQKRKSRRTSDVNSSTSV